eukprot:1609457-Amphidinium_carterae.2
MQLQRAGGTSGEPADPWSQPADQGPSHRTPADQWTSGPSGPADQRTSGPSGPADQRPSGPADRAPADEAEREYCDRNIGVRLDPT